LPVLICRDGRTAQAVRRQPAVCVVGMNVSNGQVELSLVLPAYNEALRLPAYLPEIRRYLDDPRRTSPASPEARPCETMSYEVIVGDDGSNDRTAEIVREASTGWPQLRLIRHPENRGKGAAVRTGVLASCGRRVLFADADGATPIDQEARLRQGICDGADVAIGSRLMPADDITASRNALRAWIGRAFACVASRLLQLGVRDTQCGFKMFRGDAARSLFSELNDYGYLFDLEILLRAEGRKLKIVEIPVNWHEVPGGHFRLIRAMPRIACGLWQLRRWKRHEYS